MERTASIAGKLKKDRKTRVNAAIVAAALLVIVILSLSIPGFMTGKNMINLFDQLTTTGIMCIGMTLVLIVGGIDLSMPYVLISAACVGAKHMAEGGSMFTGILIMVAVGAVFGIINGFAVAKLRMIPFITTLSTMMIAEGFAVAFTKSKSITGLPEHFTAMGGKIGGVFPIPVLIMLILLAVFAVILMRTRIGRIWYLIGINEETARVCGINTTVWKFLAYLLCGILSGVTAAVVTSRIGMAGTQMVSDTTSMDAICGCVIGGASLNGGKGNVITSLLGTLFIVCITNCTNLLGVSYYASIAIKGLIICLIIGVDVIRSKG